MQVYAPTTGHPDVEVEAMYEDISKAIHTHKTHFTVVMGDFNAKLGKRTGDELRVGKFGFERRNPRGQLLADFMEKEGLFMMNSFFRKPEHRKWTWESPDSLEQLELELANIPLHRFPNHKRFPDRFRVWVSLVGGRLETEADYECYKNKLVCDRHFKIEHKNRSKRLNALAVPSLHLTNYEEDDPPVLGQTGQIESSINVDTGEEEVLETEEIVYDDGYRCPSPEVVEKEIPKVLPVLCVKCSQLIETHLYVCASCSDSQYEPLCATCAEHAALDAHDACYVLRARVTRPKTEIRGVLCAIRSELAMKSFADDLEDAITDIKSETADIPEDTDVLDLDLFDEIDSAVAVSAEGDPNASLTTSDNEDTDDSSSEHEYTASVADRTDQDLLSLKPVLDVTTENECHKSPHPTTCLPSPKTVNVVQRRDEPQLASTRKPLHTPIGINIIRNDAQPKLQAFPAPKGTLASVTVQSDDTKSAVPTDLKRLRDDIDSYAKAKKVKSNNPQQVRTKLIILKKGVHILRNDLQIEKLNTMKEPDVQMVPKAVQNDKSPIMPKGVKEIAPESTYFIRSEELTMEPEDFQKLSVQLRNCKVLLRDLKLPPNVKKLQLISKESS